MLVVPVGLLGPLAASTDGTPPDTWLAATAWLRSSTPPPFEDLHYLSPVPQSRLPWRPPPEAYGVMSWWDYGYWLIGLAHRVPNANPTQAGARTAAAFFTETDPGRAAEILRQQRSRYVVVDGAMALRQNPGAEWLEGGFSAMLRWAGRDPDPYFERVYERDSQGRLVPLNVYFPAYYRSMLGRMLALDLPDEPPPAAVVVTLLQRRDDRGRTFHEVVRQRRFPTASEARRYLEVVGGPADRLVGLHPYRSPVVAELPEWLRPLHEILPEDPSGSPVRIFEARP